MNQQQIRSIKELIEYGDLEHLQHLWHEFSTIVVPEVPAVHEQHVRYENNAFLFRVFFIHACMYNQINIAKWLYELYLGLDIVAQIGLRHVFNYCHYLTKKQFPNSELATWLYSIVLSHKTSIKDVT